MDKLQHIDDLLRKASQVPANALVNDSDWKAVEKKLRHRKIRIYAMWIFLALITVSITIGSLYNLDKPVNTTISQTIEEPTTPNKDITPNTQILDGQTETLENAKTKGETVIVNMDNSTEHIQYLDNENWISFIPQPEIAVYSGTKPLENLTQDSKEKISPLESIQIPRLISAKQFYVTNKKLIKVGDLELKQPSNFDKKKDENNKIGKSPSYKGHLEVGLAFTPSISSKFVSENSALAGLINKDYYNFVGNNEAASFSNSYGINLQYHAPKNYFIASGLFVSQRTESVDYDYIVSDDPFSNGETKQITGYIGRFPIDFDTVKFSGSNSYHFIEVPLNIGYKTPISTNFEIRSQIGVSYLQLIQREGKSGDFYDLSLKDLNELNLNTHNVAANMKVGVYFNTSRFAIGLEPTAGVNINSLSSKSASAIKTNPYSYGINLTTNFKLKKK